MTMLENSKYFLPVICASTLSLKLSIRSRFQLSWTENVYINWSLNCWCASQHISIRIASLATYCKPLSAVKWTSTVTCRKCLGSNLPFQILSLHNLLSKKLAKVVHLKGECYQQFQKIP